LLKPAKSEFGIRDSLMGKVLLHNPRKADNASACRTGVSLCLTLANPGQARRPSYCLMKKVLVIDDSPEVRDVIRGTLALKGFQTLLAEDGLVGIQLAREHLPALILCDINMPNLDGYATLNALRGNALTSTIPFIFLSGCDDKRDVGQGMELAAANRPKRLKTGATFTLIQRRASWS